MDKPRIASLEIRNFRGFEHIALENLGHVNLFVGKNSVGKSSLLEAIRIYATGPTMGVLGDVIVSRDDQQAAGTEGPWPAILGIFRGRGSGPDVPIPISIRTSEKTLTIAFGWFEETRNPLSNFIQLIPALSQAIDGGPGLVPALTIDDGKLARVVRLDRNFSTMRPNGREPGASMEHYGTFVGPGGLRSAEVAEMWDRIALSSSEDDVIRALQLIVPEVERVTIVGSGKTGDRSVRAKLRGDHAPVPLKSLGDGLNRVFGITLGLVSAKDGILMIDEVENGLHYSVQPAFWRFLLSAAARLNVQVFATTHSLDCVLAFQRASAGNVDTRGVLTRLDKRRGRIVPLPFSEEELELAAREKIEIR